MSKPLPKYLCHKEVQALKIESVHHQGNGIYVITPADAGYAPFTVTSDYVDKHGPKAGGYYVLYKDGYASFSPAVAFEEGYTRVAET